MIRLEVDLALGVELPDLAGGVDGLRAAASTARDSCGQSYKASTIVIYASRVVPDLKIPHITTLES